MGYFSEMSMEMQNGRKLSVTGLPVDEAAFEDGDGFDELPVPPVNQLSVQPAAEKSEQVLPLEQSAQAVTEGNEEAPDGDCVPDEDAVDETPAAKEATTAPDDTSADEEKRRAEHEAAEVKRKAEWEAKQAEKKKAIQEQIDRLAAMSDNEVMTASMERVSKDVEKLTRRNMKECVSEYIQTLCLGDPAFARLTMHPKKSMIHCFQYINRKAWDYIQDELKASGITPGRGREGYGCDVPDDLCYQWAEDYFRDPDVKEDQEQEEKFIPRPYAGKVPSKAEKKKKAEKKPAGKKKPETKPQQEPEKKASSDGQLSLLDFGMAKAG